ncbi:MAG: hypothetical protein NTV86_21825 [Planctomycetota bacterium]|nr:hypothetical protein [Planctomycetota bacterium]
MQKGVNDPRPGLPEAAAGEPPTTRPAEAVRLEQLGRVIVTWEKLRLVYNAIGFFPAVLIVMIPTLYQPLVKLAVWAILANLCFCLGPLVDGYLTWFGFRRKAVTVVLFVIITAAMLLAAWEVFWAYFWVGVPAG